MGCLLVFSSLLWHASAAPPNSLPRVDEVASAKSVFMDNAQFGKDPFFPKSSRRAVAVNVSTTNPDVESTQVTGLLLKGISGLAGKRLAIINNRTFEVGEEMVLRVGGQSFKVRCIEIREKSAIININGQIKELFLGQRSLNP